VVAVFASCSTAPSIPTTAAGQPDSALVEAGPRRTDASYRPLMQEVPAKTMAAPRDMGADPMPTDENNAKAEKPQHSGMKQQQPGR
jgi:hypothetical protein